MNLASPYTSPLYPSHSFFLSLCIDQCHFWLPHSFSTVLAFFFLLHLFNTWSLLLFASVQLLSNQSLFLISLLFTFGTMVLIMLKALQSACVKIISWLYGLPSYSSTFQSCDTLLSDTLRSLLFGVQLARDHSCLKGSLR